MASILPLIFSFVLFVSCGKHDQKSQGKDGVAGQIQINSLDALSQAVVDEDLIYFESYVLRRGDVDRELENGRTLLTEACHWNRYKIISFLVSHKASLDKKDRAGKSALDYAEEDINIKRAMFPELVQEQKLALLNAIKSNQLNELKKILADNPPVNFFLEDGETLLTYCVKSKLENVLRLLAQPKVGLDVNLPNALGETPLRIAKQMKFVNIEKLLIRLGAKE